MDSSNSKPKETSIVSLNESFNLNQDQEPEEVFYSSSENHNIDTDTNKDIDPNFKDIQSKEEEEKRRRKEVEEFEKSKKNKKKENNNNIEKDNIIDFDENKEDSFVVDEGVILNNINYVSKTKINDIHYKNSFGHNSNNNENKKGNEFEDLESKITQIKNISSYSKDDININTTPSKINKENIKFKYNDKINIIKESEINSYSNFDINESNYDMNFYDTTIKNQNSIDDNTNNVFESLVPNKIFKKFLKDKIKYYMNEKDIPKNFINNLYLEKGDEISNNIKNLRISSIKMNTSNKYDENFKSMDIDKFNIYSNENMSNNRKIKNKNIKRNKSVNLFHKNPNNYNKYNINNNDTQKLIIKDDSDIIDENKINKIQYEEMIKELNIQKNENNEKSQKINLLENINDNLKQEMNKLQQNFEYERINNSENKKNYGQMKNNYNDMKNQYDLLNIKYMTLNDENFNYRRNKELYERQIAQKNEMIENLIENKTLYQKQKVKNELYKINHSTKSSHKIISGFINDKKEENKNNINNNNNNNVIDYGKYDKLRFPELQKKRDELSNERKDLNNIYSKIPLKTNNRELIQKKINLEKRLKEINCDLMLVKLSIKNYKSHK